MKNVLTGLAVLVMTNAFGQLHPHDAIAPYMNIPIVQVQGGKYVMGINGGLKKESPAHMVTVKDFYMGKYEVTQALWLSVMGYNPSTFRGCDDCPAEQVTPQQADTFIQKLNKLTGKKYRLPTEAEWEYAALGGSKTQGFKYPGSNNLNEVAWNKNNADNKTHPVGQKKPNELGLYDMSGNVWELCEDWYDDSFYKKSPLENPSNQKTAKYRVLRGGSWRSGENRCYSRARNRNIKDHRKSNGGFRLVLDF